MGKGLKKRKKDKSKPKEKTPDTTPLKVHLVHYGLRELISKIEDLQSGEYDLDKTLMLEKVHVDKAVKALAKREQTGQPAPPPGFDLFRTDGEQGETPADNPDKFPESAADIPSYAASELGLKNKLQYDRLCEYLLLNGPFIPCAVPGTGTCLFTVVRHALAVRDKYFRDYPRYPNRWFRWYCIPLMIRHREEILKNKWQVIAAEYDGEEGRPGPFSFRNYLCYMLDRNSWGDECVLYALTLEWEATIIIVQGETLFNIPVTKAVPLHEADIVIIYNGWNHYSGAALSYIIKPGEDADSQEGHVIGLDTVKPPRSGWRLRHLSDTEDSGWSTAEEEAEEGFRARAPRAKRPAPVPTPTPAPGPSVGEDEVVVKRAELSRLLAGYKAMEKELLSLSKKAGVAPPQLEPAPDFPEVGDSLVCPICHRHMGSETKLKKHMRLHKAESAADVTSKPVGHKCTTCGRIFSKKVSLTKHLPQCGELFTCGWKDPKDPNAEECGKTFQYKSGLAKHMMIHQKRKRKPLKQGCSFCGKKGFTSITAHIEHEHYCPKNTTESKRGPFPCLFKGCKWARPGNEFRTPKQRNVHMFDVHNFNPKGVQGCQKPSKGPDDPSKDGEK